MFWDGAASDRQFDKVTETLPRLARIVALQIHLLESDDNLMAKRQLKAISLLISISVISGCTVFPGTHLSTSGKDVVKQEDADFDIDKLVNIYPMTPKLLDSMRPTQVVAQSNAQLDASLRTYEYRIGIGDSLTLPSGITLSWPRLRRNTAVPATQATGYIPTARSSILISVR